MKTRHACCSANTLGRRGALALLAAFGVTPEVLAQDATKIAPRAYRIALENEHVRVLEYVARPNSAVCGEGMHSHPKHVTIALTDAKLRVNAPDREPRIANVKAGTVLWFPAEKHRAESIGGAGTRFFIIELKDQDWQPSTG